MMWKKEKKKKQRETVTLLELFGDWRGYELTEFLDRMHSTIVTAVRSIGRYIFRVSTS